MPSYRSKCEDCEAVFDYIAPVSERDMGPCTECGGPTFRFPQGLKFHDWHQATKSTLASPYMTTNIHPDGKPIEVRGHAQLQEECKKAGVVPAWEKENRIG